MALLQTVKSVINQRLCAAAEEIFVVIERILTDYEHHAYCSKQQRTVLDMVLNADINHRAGFFDLPDVCADDDLSTDQQETDSTRLVQEEPEPPPIKEEEQDILQRPEEPAAASTFTLLAVKTEHYDDDYDNRETEHLASTSADHVKTQADVKDCRTSPPTRDDQLFPPCSKTDTEDSEEWEESGKGQLALNTTKSHRMQHVEGHRLSLSDMSQDSSESSSKQTQFVESCLMQQMRSYTGRKTFTCKDCGKGYRQMGGLKQHMRSHTGEKPFSCKVCKGRFTSCGTLKNHMMIHTGEKPYACTVCKQRFIRKYDLKMHMRIHTGEKPFTCPVCRRSFIQGQHLKGHMKTHTGESRRKSRGVYSE